MKNIIKKTIIYLSSFTVATSIIAPVAYTSFISNNSVNVNVDQAKYKLGDAFFYNKEDLLQFAKQMVKKDSYETKVNEVWTLKSNNKIEFFDNPTDLLNFVKNKINKFSSVSSTDLQTNADNTILENQYDKIHVLKNNEKLYTTKIYRGKNNQIFTSEKAAKDSYLTFHDAYYFDGIYFRTKEELRAYIELNSDKYKDQLSSNTNNFVISAPNGNNSRTIDFSVINDKDTKQYIESFVNINKKEYLEIVDQNNRYNYYDKNDIELNPVSIINAIDDYSYIDIDENQGKSSYVVDLDKEDESNLYGPYYIKSGTSILQMQNKDLWRKVDYTDNKFIENALESNIITEFLNNVGQDITIFGSDKSKANNYPFLISGLETEEKKYFDMLKDEYPVVYSELMQLINAMKSGKKFNQFLKLPIAFINIIENLIKQKAPQVIFDQTRKVFNNVAIKYDQLIKTIFPRQLLLRKDAKNEVFSIQKLLAFDKQNFNLNVDVESYIDIISQEYPDLLQGMKFVSNLALLNTKFANIIQPDLDLYRKLFDKKLSSKYDYWFIKIWKCMNSINEKELMNNLKEILDSNNLPSNDLSIVNSLFSQNIFLLNRMIAGTINSVQDGLQKIKSGKIIDKSDLIYGLSNEAIGKIDDLILNSARNYKEIISILFLQKCFKNNSLSISINQLLKTFDNLKKIINSISSFNLMEFFAKSYFDDKSKSKTKIISNNINNFSNNVSFDISALLDEKVIDLAENILDILQLLKVGCSFIPVLKFALIAADIILTLANEFYKQELNSYVFENEDVKYIWDGGRTDLWLFGLIKNEISGIQDMKLIGPYEVNEQHNRHQYYYNGKIYDDLNHLKKQQINDILNGIYKNKSVNTVYTFDSIISKTTLERPNVVFDEIGSLNDNLENGLVDYVFQAIINKDKNYVRKNLYEYSGGFTFDKTLSDVENISKIINSIKPVSIVTLPTLNANNNPINIDDETEDHSVPVYELPEKSWTPLTGLKENKTNNKYLIYNPNLDKNSSELNDLTFNKFIELFYSSFDVDSKKILSDELNKKPLFSQYTTNLIYQDLYCVKNDKGEQKIFDSEFSAINWLLKYYDFTVYKKTFTTTTYELDGHKFANLDDYLQWILSKAERI